MPIFLLRSKLYANGGVASLRDQSIALDDDTLEFYGVVPNAIRIAMSDDNLNCGTNENVGDAAFLDAGGGTIDRYEFSPSAQLWWS